MGVGDGFPLRRVFCFCPIVRARALEKEMLSAFFPCFFFFFYSGGGEFLIKIYASATFRYRRYSCHLHNFLKDKRALSGAWLFKRSLQL